LHDAIIVGSGPAGAFSAYALQGRDTLVLDVGHRPPPPPPDFQGNLYALRQQREDLFEELIGSGFEGFHNIHKRDVSLKLKAPLMSYIIRDWERLMPVQSHNFHAVASFAVGGLANAWGAGVFRFTQRDLDGFPIAASDLEPFYNQIGAHIGISGVSDDLEPYFGVEPHLLPPTRIPRLAADILERFRARKAYFQERGITMGRSRLAVLTVPHNGRAPYAYDNLEFYRPYNPAIYNPAFTLDELAARHQVTLRTGYHVSHYQEVPGGVQVIARNLATGGYETFQGKKLILAAGTLGSTRIALESKRDYQSRLPILDNPMACVPLFRLSRIGSPLEVNDGALGQVNLIYDQPGGGELLQATVYGTTGPLRSDVLFQFPLSISANLTWSRYLSPAMALMMLFYPGKRDPANYIRLTGEGALDINYDWKSSGSPERRLIAAFRRLGYLSASPLCQYPPMGSSLHYAGTLPMKAVPGPYQTDANGRLFGTQSVYVADGACFSELPAKNLTFTIMANAARIAGIVRRTIE
jgi:choline dehydrogenase-like flavoprotein